MDALQPSAIDAADQRALDECKALYERALSLWHDGDFQYCLSVLDAIPHSAHSSESILLQARALIRAGFVEDAERWLAENALRYSDDDARATHAMLLGYLYALAGEFRCADRNFRRSRNLKPHHTIAAETNYYQALARYQAKDYIAARKAVASALDPIEDIVYVRARALVGWIDMAEGRYASAQQEFTAALDAFSGCRARDTHLQASLLHSLAIAAAELCLGDTAALDREAQQLRWTSNLVCAHVQTLRHLGLAYQRQGLSQLAADRFTQAAEVAPATPWAIFGQCDNANLMFACGEPTNACVPANEAARLAERIDLAGGWEQIDGEQRLSLLVLAQILGRLGDGERAKRFLALYYARPNIANTSALLHDTRLSVFETHVEALVLAALGRQQKACALLEAAVQGWSSIMYRARAAEAFADLVRVDPDRISTYVQTEYAPTVEGEREEPGGPGAEILSMVLAGLNDDAIALQLGLSQKAVKGVVSDLYTKFGVKGRTQLIAAARAPEDAVALGY